MHRMAETSPDSQAARHAVTPWKDAIHMAYNAPLTAEDRIRAKSENGTVAVVRTTDLRCVLSTLDALRRSYAERGAIIARLAGDDWQEKGVGA